MPTRPERPQAIMIDDPTPVRDATITGEMFRDIAEDAGLQLKAAMEQDMESTTRTSGFAPFPIEDYQDSLEKVMKHFETKVSGSNDACSEKPVAQITPRYSKSGILAAS